MKKMIKISLLILCIGLISSFSSVNYTDVNEVDEVCVSKAEMELYNLIMEYRKKNNLPIIPLSKSLTHVAQTHAKDVQNNHPDKGTCNLHSWSDKGEWTSCCYTSDHKKSQCMWDKPRELTSYTGNGYEISIWNSAGVTPASALEGWKNSSGHNKVILNQGIWTNQWQSIGIGIYEEYAMVWFGEEPDTEGKPSKCN